MPLKLLHNGFSANDNGNKIDTSLFVQKKFLRTNYIESNIEENIHFRNQIRIKKIPVPINNREAASKL